MEINKGGTRFFELDYLRGIAALSVVLFHFTYAYDNGLKIVSPDKFYFKYGNCGVYLFFMISGFVIFMTLSKVKKPSDFIISRFIRLYPSYWCCLILSIVFVNIFKSPFNYHIISIYQFVINVTMFQNWFRVKDIDGVYWTLAVELTFYILLFSLFLLNQLKNIQYWVLLWIFGAIFPLFFNIPYQNYINALFILEYAPLFIAGIIFYILSFVNKRKINYVILIFSLIVESAYQYKTYHSFVSTYIIFIFYAIFYVLSYTYSKKDRKEQKLNEVLLFLGNISYPLYLIHENVGLTTIFYLKKLYDFQVFYIPVTICFVVFLATMISLFIEKPVMKYLKMKLLLVSK